MIGAKGLCTRVARLVLGLSAIAAFAGVTSRAPAQSQSGFTYNGLNFTSYQANEYLNSSAAASSMRATGASHTAVMVTQYQQTSTSNTIAPETTSSPGYNSNNDPLSPTDAAVVSAIQSAQAKGLTVSLKPQVDSLDGMFRGNFAPTDPAAWFSSYRTFLFHYAEIAAQNNVGILVIGTELKSLSGAAYKSYWDSMIAGLRAQYPNLTLAYGANATYAGDEFTSVSFWGEVDIIGVDGYFPLTNQTDPPLSALVSAWTNNRSGFNIVAALKNLQSTYNKPLIFTEIGYVSVAGTNEQPFASLPGSYDGLEQQDCYEAFFEVFSQQTAWMKGVFWWDWSVSAPGTGDTGYSSQNKPAGTVTLPKWFNSTNQGFTIAPSTSTVSVGQGLSNPVTISVTPQGGFTGAVTLSATGLPSGVTATFSNGAAAGTQVLTLTASNSAAIAGPATVTLTGTSGSLSASSSLSVSVVAATAQTITFANPGSQKAGASLSLVASASSGLPVSFASTTPAICTVNSASATATLLAAGTCTITASQSGNNSYAAAAPVSDAFQVTSLPPVPVPANADVVVSQVNWRASLGGNAYAAGNPAGSSFGVNSNGLIAIANTSNVVLFNAQTGANITLGAWSSASALAVDTKNNLYVGNPYGPLNAIVKIPYVGGTANGGYAAFAAPTATTPVCTPSSTAECVLPGNLGSVNPASMAFDATGNLFYATAGDGSSGGNSIYECTVACQGGTGSSILIFTEPQASPAPSSTSGQLLVGSMSFDSAGNLFFSDSSIYVNPSNYGLTSFFSNLNELPVSSGTGFGGKTTGYAPSPSVLYTVTPATVGAFDNQLDGVAVSRSTNGDTVYFADQSDGIFAFPDSAGGFPVVNGRPTALYAVSTQGAKTLAIDGQNKLYLASYSSVFGSGGDTVAQVTVGTVSVPASPVGTAVSPSATLAPVTTLLNDTTCSATPAPSVNFVAGTSLSATSTASTTGSCSGTLSGGAAFSTAISFTPTTAGPDTISLSATDQGNNVGSVVVNGVGAGFTLSASAPSLSVNQGSSATETITVADQGGFTGSVSLAVTGLPSGVTATFATNPATSSSTLMLAASSTASVGGPVNVTVTGTSGATTGSTTFAISVTSVPGFTIAPSATSLAITQGASASDNITVMPTNGFTAGVTLAATGLPAGVTATFAPNPTTTGSSVLSLAATSAASAGGPVAVTITGTSGSLTQSTTVSLTVNVAPGFSLSAAPGALTLLQGNSGSSTVTVAGVGGFSGPVTLAATGLPSGVTATFANNPTTSASVVTFSANSTATTGPATITITGTSGTLTASTTIALTLNAPPSFSLSASPTAISLPQAGSATDAIAIIAANGFTGSVTLAATGLPSGVTASFANKGATGSSALTLSASASAGVGGPVTVTITGTSGALTASTTIALTVTPPPSFTLSPAPSAVTLTEGSSSTATINIVAANGFAGPVTLAATGLPTGVTASFASNQTTSGANLLTLSASGAAQLGGPVTVTITGTSGTLTSSTVLAVTVTQPVSFTLSAAPATLSLAQGASTTSTITVISIGGFTGTVALSTAGLPSGVTASFANGASSGTQVLTLTASGAATVGGPVSVTVNGTSGVLTASTSVTLVVSPAPGFTLAGSAISVVRGATSGNTSSISVTPINGFTGTVALSCSISPLAASDPATCTLSPNSLSLSGGAAQTSTLTVNTTAATTAGLTTKPTLWSLGGGTVLAALLFFRLPKRRRNLPALLSVLLLLSCVGAIGCGGKSAPPPPTGNPGTTPGTYNVTVTGTSGSIVSSSAVTLTVQ